MSVTALCMAPFIAKKRNTATQASLVYPPDTLLFGCQFQCVCVEDKSHKSSLISEWHVRTFIHRHVRTVSLAFLNTVLLFVNNHGNCKMICLCVHIHQNGHQDSSTFKVMIEKLTVSSGPSPSGPSQFCVTDLTFICKSHVRHRQSQVPSRFVRSVTGNFFLDKCVKYSKICLSNYIHQNNNSI